MNKSLIFTVAYTNNLMFFTGLVIILTFFRHEALAAEIAIIYSSVSLFNQIFSYNLKNLILFDNNKKFASDIFKFRLFLGTFICLFYLFFLKNFDLNFYFSNLILILTIIVIQQWLIEIIIIINEIDGITKPSKNYNLISLFNFLLILTNILFFNNNFLEKIFVLIVIENLIFILLNLNISKKFDFQFLQIFNSITKIFALASSISIILSIFFWRLFIYLNYEKEIAGILFSSFAIGSFIGSFFSISIGPSIVKNRINISNYLKLYVFLCFIIMGLIFLILNYHEKFNLDYNQLYFLKSVNYSVAGSSLMLFAAVFRLNFFYTNINKRKYVFRWDMINSLLLSIIPMAIFYIDKNYIITSYFIASTISLIMNFYLYKK
jgi:hypothetical protein